MSQLLLLSFMNNSSENQQQSLKLQEKTTSIWNAAHSTLKILISIINGCQSYFTSSMGSMIHSQTCISGIFTWKIATRYTEAAYESQSHHWQHFLGKDLLDRQRMFGKIMWTETVLQRIVKRQRAFSKCMQKALLVDQMQEKEGLWLQLQKEEAFQQV